MPTTSLNLIETIKELYQKYLALKQNQKNKGIQYVSFVENKYTSNNTAEAIIKRADKI